MTTKEPLRQLEFFSGIGGMRVALAQALEDHPHYCLGTVTAFDCSPYCQQAYGFNFNGEGEAAVQGKMIEQLDVKLLDGVADIWTMSPPCQPFTKCTSAKQLGSKDNRSKAFANLMRVLPLLNKKPRWIFFENVKPFGGSTVHAHWQAVLKDSGYKWREYLLTPSQIGIPNQRSRHYFACELVSGSSAAGGGCGAASAAGDEESVSGDGADTGGDDSLKRSAATDAEAAAEADARVDAKGGGWAPAQSPGLVGALNTKLNLEQIAQHFARGATSGSSGGGSDVGDGSCGSGDEVDDVADPEHGQRSARRLKHWILSDDALKKEYHGEVDACNFEALVVPDSKLSKPWAQASCPIYADVHTSDMTSHDEGLSYVGADDRTTYCFTSAYGKTFHKSSGSLLHRTCSRGRDVERPANMASVHSGSVRLFSPLELLRLFGFPDSYRFPPGMQLKHRYKLIGQSINVGVVELVMRSVFWDEGNGAQPLPCTF